MIRRLSDKVVKKRPRFLKNNSDKAYTNNRKITEVLKPNQWKDQPCYVVGGGEALSDFDFEKLKGKHTIGINKTFLYFTPEILYSMDVRYYFWIMEGKMDEHDGDSFKGKWLAFPGTKVFLCPISFHRFHNSVYLVRRMKEKGVYTDLNNGIYGGNNSGFGAMMLAIALGANPIYLLGFSMKCKNSTHFHSGYPGSSVERMNKKVISYKKMFEKFAPDIKGLGRQVINVVMKDENETELKCFDIKKVSEVI